VKKVLGALGLTVNRLIRLSFGPFQLGDLAEREVREIRGRMLRDQLGPRLIEAAGANFDAPLVQRAGESKPEPKRAERTGRTGPGQNPRGQKPAFKLSRGQAAEDSLERLDTRKGSRGQAETPGHGGKPRAGGKTWAGGKPRAGGKTSAGGKTWASPNTDGKPSGRHFDKPVGDKRMRGDARPRGDASSDARPRQNRPSQNRESQSRESQGRPNPGRPNQLRQDQWQGEVRKSGSRPEKQGDARPVNRRDRPPGAGAPEKPGGKPGHGSGLKSGRGPGEKPGGKPRAGGPAGRSRGNADRRR
jgi:23S rRNA pseudouridine2605 synthase